MKRRFLALAHVVGAVVAAAVGVDARVFVRDVEVGAPLLAVPLGAVPGVGAHGLDPELDVVDDTIGGHLRASPERTGNAFTRGAVRRLIPHVGADRVPPVAVRRLAVQKRARAEGGMEKKAGV